MAAYAPCSLSSAVLLAITCLLLAPCSEASFLVTRSSQKTQTFSERSLLSIEQVPGPTPQYVAYGPPEFTTFSNLTTACQACIEFFPEKQDAKRFHSALYEDKDGGNWDRACRAGSCNFRDPQTQPVGGVIGQDLAEGKSCITQDPVPWYADCEPIALVAANSLLEVTHYCSYQEQIFIPPPNNTVSRFHGAKNKAWDRIGGSKEKCLSVVAEQGTNLFDDMTFCDADLAALSGCCETVFDALTCVAENSQNKGLWNPADGSVFTQFDKDGAQMLEHFAKFCVPLCQNTKEEFCEQFPNADPCVTHDECSACTAGGGLWCPKLESCHCPGPKPPCIKPPVTTPMGCLPKEKKEVLGGVGKVAADAKIVRQKADEEAAAEAASEKAICKYSKFAQEWLKK